MFNKELIKLNLEKILRYYGAMPSNCNWHCVPSRHEDPRNNLTVKGTICACHCGLKGDSFSVIAEMESLDYRNKSDFSLIAKKANEILQINENLPVKNYTLKYNTLKYNLKKTNKNLGDFSITKIITEKFKKAKKYQYQYFFKRGLINPNIFIKHKIIVSNPKKIFPNEILPKLKNIWAYEYIIPVWNNGKVVNCILRRNDWKNKDNNKTLNLKGFKVEFLNSDYLKEKNLNYLFVCEGWSDALSFENLGYKAIAINSIVLVNKFVQAVENNKNGLKDTMFFIGFDQDKKGWGQKAGKQLVKQLKEKGFKSFNLRLKDNYKDINEYYCKDKNSFKKSIKYLLANK